MPAVGGIISLVVSGGFYKQVFEITSTRTPIQHSPFNIFIIGHCA